MLTGELKNRINSLWEIFWTGGITNPLDVVEQMTYLMFIRDLDDTDNLRAKESAMLGLPHKSIFADEVKIGDRTIPGNQLKWSVFHDFPAGKMYATVQEWVFPFIKTLHGDKSSAYAKYMDDAIFKIPTPLMLDKIVTALDGIYEQMAQIHDSDTRGDIYEYLLSKIATAGVNGQFRTPRHIIRMDGTSVSGAVPVDAEGGRSGSGHRAGRRAVRILHGAQGDPQGTGGGQPAGSGHFHALRRVQALRRRVHRDSDLYQDRPRRHG